MLNVMLGSQRRIQNQVEHTRWTSLVDVERVLMRLWFTRLTMQNGATK